MKRSSSGAPAVAAVAIVGTVILTAVFMVAQFQAERLSHQLVMLMALGGWLGVSGGIFYASGEPLFAGTSSRWLLHGALSAIAGAILVVIAIFAAVTLAVNLGARI